MSRRILRTHLGAVALALPLLVVPAASHALVVDEFTSDYAAFAGDGCGSTSQASLRYPARAWKVSITRPLVGQTFRDVGTDNPVAQITAAKLDRDTHHARWTATGVQDACTEPDLYTGVG